MVEATLRYRNIHFNLPDALKVAGTFALVTFAWIFFRANSFGDALYVAGHLFAFDGQSLTDPFAAGLLGAHAEFLLSCGLIGLVIAVDWLVARCGGFDELLRLSPTYLRWATYYAAGAAVIFSGLYGVGAQQFIYFRF